jgi:hypothetical protein
MNSPNVTTHWSINPLPASSSATSSALSSAKPMRWSN